jgi:hypothetical protein
VRIRWRRLALTFATLILLGVPASALARPEGAGQKLIDAYAPIVMLREQQDPPCETSAEQYQPTTVDTMLGNPKVDLTRDEEGEVLVKRARPPPTSPASATITPQHPRRSARRHLRLRA